VNIKLKTRIIEKGLSQLKIARDTGVSDSYLSKVVNGWVDPPKEVKAKLAGVLGSNIKEIFPGVKHKIYRIGVTGLFCWHNHYYCGIG
jgi:transcriptional regulator with XRE-family HTH domain